MVFEAELLVHFESMRCTTPMISSVSWSGRTKRCASSWVKHRTRNRPCKRAAHFVAVHNAQLARANRQVAIAVRLRILYTSTPPGQFMGFTQ